MGIYLIFKMETNKEYDVFGIGSALMDFLLEVEDDILIELDLRKGQFHLLPEEESKKLFDRIRKFEIKTAPGGSSANTLYGVAILGGKVVFCGKVGHDEHGSIYEKKMVDCGMRTNLAKSDTLTGNAITFITPDSQRTFAVCLGAAMELKNEDVFFDDIKKSKILHIEGYQLEDPNLKAVSLNAMKHAKENKTLISIDLGDPGIVERNKEEILSMIKDYADIVFANEDEAKALTGLEPEKALEEISKYADTAIVKIGSEGSFIKNESCLYKIPGYRTTAVDTTGAGDMFAAGVLYGIIKKYGLQIAGHIGSFFASKVVEIIGARLEYIDVQELDELIKNVDKDKDC